MEGALVHANTVLCARIDHCLSNILDQSWIMSSGDFSARRRDICASACMDTHTHT